MKKFILTPGELSFSDLRQLVFTNQKIELAEKSREKIQKSRLTIETVLKSNQTVYGVNTGFGILANQKISPENLRQLQENLILSHAAGVGELFSDEIVKLILLLKINSLARGYSGVRLELIMTLIAFYNAEYYPCISSQGSVGASGDLAPLAHLSCALLGVGSVRSNGKVIKASEALEKLGLKPCQFEPKEGLALINGVQVSTALLVKALLELENLFSHALTTAALSVEALKGSDSPFDPRIHAVRGHQGQIECAKKLKELLAGSELRSHQREPERVQDPYSLRCLPQVLGACLDQMRHSAKIALIEVNAVSDNPLIFSEDSAIVSGGNFHGEPVAMASDNLALAIAEIGALSERRIALLCDSHLSGLPAFLVKDSGLNSGFMIAHVTSAALASENKSLAHPACVDSLPTSANQEDHVSMATFAARRLLTMLDNTRTVIAIELLAACQGLDFHKPLKTSISLEKVRKTIRSVVPFYEKDRHMATDIEAVCATLKTTSHNQEIFLD